MKKVLVLLTFISASLLSAEDVDIFNFTIVPGINTVNRDSTVIAATGLISSEVYKLNGIQLGPIFSVTKSDMNGLQAAGVFNLVRGSSDGIQLGGVFNYTSGGFNGIQGSGYVNVVNGQKFDGAQLAGLHNSSKDLLGVQISGLSNYSHNIVGLQGAGAINIAKDVYGLQGAGAINIAKSVDGLQASGVFNLSQEIDGLQISGLINYANKLDGLQSSGFINIAKDLSGFQVAGLMNIAKNLNGLQIGVINIVTESSNGSIPIGVLNLYKDGIHDISVWVDENSMVYTGIETGSKHVYTLLYTGAEADRMAKMNHRVFGTGLGYRFFTDFFINFDIVAGSKMEYNKSRDDEDDYYCHSAYFAPDGKVSVSLKLGSFSLVGGVHSNLQIDGQNEEANMFKGKDYYKINSDLRAYYSYFIGAKLSL